MGERALWPMVVVVATICSMLTIMVVRGIEPVALVAVLGVIFAGISSLIGVLLYGKMMQVEKNTNGTASADKELIKSLVETLKQAPAIKD